MVKVSSRPSVGEVAMRRGSWRRPRIGGRRRIELRASYISCPVHILRPCLEEPEHYIDSPQPCPKPDSPSQDLLLSRLTTTRVQPTRLPRAKGTSRPRSRSQAFLPLRKEHTDTLREGAPDTRSRPTSDPERDPARHLFCCTAFPAFRRTPARALTHPWPASLLPLFFPGRSGVWPFSGDSG